ncbi:restriction endonuclease [Candidatus Micrarchaeota archaeon]|nr:restriction endonuclease [Candidatus Micrarchaeota archaeon]
MVFVKKLNGELEAFSDDKILHSLRRVGLSIRVSKELLTSLKTHLYEGISTKQIYRILNTLINEEQPEVSHKFNLKKALFELGPEGHYFEDFMAKLLSHYGYSCQTRFVAQGQFVSHEIDVVAIKGSSRFAIECKFHNEPGIKCRIQTILYVYARFLDLEEGSRSGKCLPFSHPWLITNTKFSQDVISYAQGMRIPLLGWHYPLDHGLEKMIEESKCYPITVINLQESTRSALLRSGVVSTLDLPASASELAAKTSLPLGSCKQLLEKAKYSLQ